MKYAVLFYEINIGYYFNEYSKIFISKQHANKYRNKLNRDIRKENSYSLKDYYIIVKVK